MTALPRASLGTLFGRRREMRCIFAFFARRHCRGREMRNAKPPRAATIRDQLLEEDAHTSIKRVLARRKAGTRFPRRRALESAAATSRFALLASFVPQGFFSSVQWCGISCRLVSCKLAPSRSHQSSRKPRQPPGTAATYKPARSKHRRGLQPARSKHRRCLKPRPAPSMRCYKPAGSKHRRCLKAGSL